MPLELLPKTREEAVRLAHKGNRRLEERRIAADLAEEAIVKTTADEFYPTLEAIAEENRKIDQGGTAGSKMERIIKVELSYDFNLGLTAINTLKASKQSHLASVNIYGDTRDFVEESARNAWDNLQTARDRAGYRRNQANIAAEFLELARRERQLGNRSLIDVLAGETALINASSDAANAESDVAISVFTLINVMGQLSPDLVE
jgi:adhesin transport system outer membrane protein